MAATRVRLIRPNNAQQSNRIVDEIVCKAISIKLLRELNERYSDVTFGIMVIKCSKGDNTNRTNTDYSTGNITGISRAKFGRQGKILHENTVRTAGKDLVREPHQRSAAS